jgi:hypothetical protein
MDTGPKVPYFNVFYFIALTRLSKESYLTASNQKLSTDMSLQNLITDKGTLISDICNITGNRIYKSGKLASAMSKIIAELKPNGIYHLLYLLSKEDNPEEYLLEFKDQKSSDREYSIQSYKRRPFQYFEEMQSSTVSIAAPEDALLEAEKYCPMVESFLDIMRSKGSIALSSEDRSFFCGNMHPEIGMSTGTLIIAIEAGSISMVSSASLQRCSRGRRTVMPMGFNFKEMLKEGEYEMVQRIKYGRMEMQASIYTYKHMMQGIRAIAAGNINTAYVKGSTELAVLSTNAIKKTYSIVTSDDVGRGLEFRKEYTSESRLGPTI